MWFDEVKKYSTSISKIIVCGTKLDLESKRVITYDQAKAFCDEKQVEYCESSSKNSQNVNEIFINASLDLINKYSTFNKSTITIKHNISDYDTTPTQSGCCF